MFGAKEYAHVRRFLQAFQSGAGGPRSRRRARLGRYEPRRHRPGRQSSASPISGASSRASPASSAPSRRKSTPRCSVGSSPAGDAQSPRDRLFDIVMTRFELMQPYKARVAAHRVLFVPPSRRGVGPVLHVARLAILDAGRRRRQARRTGRRAPRRRTDRGLRQSVSGLARRPVAVARQDHGRARPEARQGRAHAVKDRDGLFPAETLVLERTGFGVGTDQ